MACEETIERLVYGPGEECGAPGSDERMALVDFAFHLGAYNCISETGIVSDERNTRKEAKLLMSLLSSPSSDTKKEGDETANVTMLLSSSSDSDQHSCASENSSAREHFTFTCPSLSLETRCNNGKSTDRYYHSSRPASLLGRPLKADDRNALRLSADAMARNIRQSFQSAINWRLHVWMQTLSKTIVTKENKLKRFGASEKDLELLLTCPEALLLLKLKGIDDIKVTSTRTSFRVLGQSPSESESENQEPPCKKQRLENLEEGDYHYHIKHVLVLECVVCLTTPAGFAEITLQVPGLIEGTFLSTETGMEQLKSVVVELDTNILTAMLEKSSRTIVRACVECETAPEPSTDGEDEKEIDVDSSSAAAEMDLSSMSPVDDASSMMMTPPAQPSGRTVTAAEVRAAIVTPKALTFTEADCQKYQAPVLLPIPDSLDDDSGTGSPRRFMPNPRAGRRLSHVPRTPLPTSFPVKRSSAAGLPLISPNVNDGTTEYQEAPGSSCPSLPLLVEVACREMQTS